MNRPAADRRLRVANGTLLLSVILLLAAAAGVLALPNSTDAREAQLILLRLSEFAFDGPASPSKQDPYDEALADARLFLRSMPGSKTAPKIRVLVAAAEGRRTDAAKILSELRTAQPDPQDLKELGMVYWGLGRENPSNFFRALGFFEQAARLAPYDPTPRYTLVRAYKKLYLKELVEGASKQYQGIEPTGLFLTEGKAEVPEDSVLINDLKHSLQVRDMRRAKELLDQFPDAFRAMALDGALNPQSDTFDETTEFALDHYGNTRRDLTMRAILDPMTGGSQPQILDARKMVQKGIAEYFKANSEESLQLFDRAEERIRNANSVFDDLWINLKQADTLMRSKQSGPAVNLLDNVIKKSRELGFDWLHGHALVARAAASMGIQNQDRILPLLNEAVRTLTSAGTPGDTARPLYYLAFTHSLAGDSETSLSMTYRGLRVTSAEDHLRLAQFYRLASLQVYGLGFPRYALPLANQALVEAVASSNPGIVAAVIPVLAKIQADAGHYETAENYLAKATAARTLMKNPQDRDTLDLVINLLCGQIKIGIKRFTEAEECLTKNMKILEAKPTPDFSSQTLMQLAQLSLARGRENEAREHLRKATEVIEQDDDYFATAALRMPFENQRRDLYDVAIGVEYDHGGKDTAWGYLQRYRSKLFLEFLRQMNPGVAGILVKAVDRNKVQQLIPDDLQTLEYVMLKDRLLIWLVSRDKFISESVDIRREDLEKKVSGFLERIIAKADEQAQAEELYNLLIRPIASRLDPNRSLAIIPDQALHRLNFAALRSPESRNFLIEQFSIVESPNLTTLLSGGSMAPSRDPAIAFGAQTDDTGATLELRQLENFYPDIKTFNKKDAVKPAFLSAMENASIFHFAGHSQDAADPLRSSILLDGEREGPNSVTAVDISRHRMPESSVVILASCDSSVGNSRDGIGMRGLTSAFLISGAGSVVGSLWPVEAKNTSKLVLDFHKNFATNHQPVATSLRNAQLAFIKRNRHPYYWSGFVVTGNTTAFRQVRPIASN